MMLRRYLPWVLVLLLAMSASAWAQDTPPAAGADVMALVRAQQWDAAQAAASQYLDPVAGKLVLFERLLTPNAADARDIAAFMAANPDWPLQAVLARRRDAALATTADTATLLALCQPDPPHLPAALLRCAAAEQAAGQTQPANAAAQAAWATGIDDPNAEAAFLGQWGTAITPATEWQRFLRLLPRNPDTARRQLARLGSGHRAAAAALLALRQNDPAAEALLGQVPDALRTLPELLLAQAAWLRRAGRTDDALALWNGPAATAEANASDETRPAFWAERNALARDLLVLNQNQAAFALASATQQKAVETIADADFLSGWIALRRLHNPAQAIPYFQHLANISSAAITQGRAHYWLGRAALAQGNAGQARSEFAAAAAWPSSYYGQLAALAMNEDTRALNARILAVRDPGWTPEQAVSFASREVARAAAMLVLWGEADHARPFLVRLETLAPTPPARAMAARLSLAFGQPNDAVAIARRAGRDGIMLIADGWPIALQPPVPADQQALVLGLIRQESSFDPGAVSPSGARGLMQLMPATARQVAHQMGGQVQVAALTIDTALNMRLGCFYLQGLLDQFGNSLPLAIASYNAGPNRVGQWLVQNGDPRPAPAGTPPPADLPPSNMPASNMPQTDTPRLDMIDWIELIPFGETRNYVQRVMENLVIYRARLGQDLPHPLAADQAALLATSPPPAKPQG